MITSIQKRYKVSKRILSKELNIDKTIRDFQQRKGIYRHKKVSLAKSSFNSNFLQGKLYKK